jgi:hypothetical protein
MYYFNWLFYCEFFEVYNRCFLFRLFFSLLFNNLLFNFDILFSR